MSSRQRLLALGSLPVACSHTGVLGVRVLRAGAPPAHRSVPMADFLEDSFSQVPVPSGSRCPPVRPGQLPLASDPVMGLAPECCVPEQICPSVCPAAHALDPPETVGLCACALDTVVWGSTFSLFKKNLQNFIKQ